MGKFLTTKEFIKRAEKVHKKKYEYSLVEYVNSKTKIKIICPEHGEFEQRPNDHLQSKGCIMCAGVKKKNKSDFVKEAKEVHGKRFNYKLVEYKSMNTKIKIICSKHGTFVQRPNDHIKGLGCAKCGRVKKLTTNEFIERARGLHSKYNYSMVNYKNMHIKVKIICSKHGEFMQTPHNHLKLAGCPKCKKSKGEKLISWFLDKKNIPYEEQKKFKNCKNKSQLPFDFYLSKYNVCIEFQGIQHYETVKCMGGEDGFMRRQVNDNIKRDYCKKNGIKLIEIKYTDKVFVILEKEFDTK
jgi:hypothetical protein